MVEVPVVAVAFPEVALLVLLLAVVLVALAVWFK
jgi:hypothetical protein